MKIQSQNTIEMLRHMAETADFKARRIAFVCGVGLIRTQMRRAFGLRHVEVFSTEAEALEFVLD